MTKLPRTIHRAKKNVDNILILSLIDCDSSDSKRRLVVQYKKQENDKQIFLEITLTALTPF